MAYKISLAGQEVTYSVSESRRARYPRFRIDAQKGLQVIIPAGMHVKNLDELFHRHQDWILKHLQRVAEMQTEQPQRQFISGESLPFLGEAHTLEVNLIPGETITYIARQEQTIQVRLQSDIPETHRSLAVRTVLQNWYRDQAKFYISNRVHELATHFGFQVGKITIRNQKTRWGSCSSKGNLNFNWRLMMAPPDAIDYLIIHELCHLREPNHSPRFWALVATYCPDYQYWKRWLKENNAYLFL